MLEEYLNRKRIAIIKRYVKVYPDLDLGAGRKRKAVITLDINRKSNPDMVADIRYLPIRDEAVSSLVCSHVIEHIRELNKTLNEIARILIKGKVAIFFVPNDRSILYNIIKPLHTIYYEKMISRLDSARTHIRSFSEERLDVSLLKFFKSVRIGKINLGMEIFAVCRK